MIYVQVVLKLLNLFYRRAQGLKRRVEIIPTFKYVAIFYFAGITYEFELDLPYPQIDNGKKYGKN